MKTVFIRLTIPAAALLGVAFAPALAQRQATPEQRIERLERQVQQVQRRVFPQGQPADTAGLSHDPAATQASVSYLDNRIVALERQFAEILRHLEENGHRANQVEAELRRLREDQDRRLKGLETRIAAAAVAPSVPASDTPAARPVESASASRPTPAPAASRPTASLSPTPAVVSASAEGDPAEIAYDEGFQLWRAGKYDQAITALRAVASSFPKHRRASWANNLAGRSMLDKGEPRAAAEALLANYRSNPKGERAADSLFYLGQALMKLNQPAQACKAYAELEAVYGDGMRGELKTLLPKAKTEAKCG